MLNRQSKQESDLTWISGNVHKLGTLTCANPPSRTRAYETREIFYLPQNIHVFLMNESNCSCSHTNHVPTLIWGACHRRWRLTIDAIAGMNADLTFLFLLNDSPPSYDDDLNLFLNSSDRQTDRDILWIKPSQCLCHQRFKWMKVFVNLLLSILHWFFWHSSLSFAEILNLVGKLFLRSLSQTSFSSGSSKSEVPFSVLTCLSLWASKYIDGAV